MKFYEIEILYLESLDVDSIDEEEINVKLNVIRKEIILILRELNEINFNPK